ncbi:hypothetical protein BV326_03740 [Pseudomonas syringae pv. actinidiae]|uniref:DUF6216 family protein n=1 Tax=Pseudomonas syringae TaxID=317 RepID=UPI000A249DFD|nr:DUF6216 family protein [Pseudomonas syringae]OSR68746.1 hypothetical protein BV326_03740 [Pseudomonas syringae pv. actinidiae]
MTDQTFTSVMHILDVLYKLWPILCGLGVVGIVFWRTRSFFFLFHQILKWLGLEGKYSNPDDQKVADDYLDLNKFNLKTGFRLQSVKAKARLHVWLNENDLEYAEVRHAGWYFRANKLTFEIPSNVQIWVSRTLLVALGCVFVAMASVLQNPNQALLKVTATDTWFWVGNNEATSLRFELPSILRGHAWKIQQHDCRYGDDAKPSDNAWDKDVICRLVVGLNEDYIADAIRTQKATGLVLGIMGFLSLGFLALSVFWVVTATNLRKRITDDGAPPNDGETHQVLASSAL